MEYSDHELFERLKSLRLHYTSENLKDLLVELEASPARQIFNRIASSEVVEQKSRSLKRRMSESKIGHFKRMEDFNWKHPAEIKSQQKLEEILCEDFVPLRKNLILIGSQGLGKTMIAKNIGASALHHGHKVRFITASHLITDLLSAGHMLESKIRYYSRIDLLIIDELGYLSYHDKAADLLFEIISRRYETAPVILTTNLAFADWPKIFPGAACVSALLDRLIHHCEIIHIKGESFRKAEFALKQS